jgi:hypothetical protein
VTSATIDSPNGGALRRALDRSGLVLGLYFLLSIVMTYPMVVRFVDSVPAGSTDVWQNYWNFWWWKKCLFELGRSPYHTEYLFHPTGAAMVFYTHSPLNMLASMPVNLALGYAAAYNFCILAAMTFSGWTAYLLVKEIAGDSFGAFLGGLAFAFFPHRMDQTIEHLNLQSTQFMPLAALFLLRLCRRGGAGSVVGLSAAFACNALVSWHLGILLSLVLAPLAIVEIARSSREKRKLFRDLAMAASLGAVLTLPASLPLIRGLGGEGYFQKPQIQQGIDPLFLFLPSPHHPIWGGLTDRIYAQRQTYFNSGFLCYLGVAPVALAALALVRRRSGAATWGGLFLGAMVLAAGAELTLGGRALDGPLLPFAILERIPGLRLMRVANRFTIVAGLALAVLAGLGWSAMRARSNRKFLALSLLILIDYLWVPYPLQRVEHPAFYARLAASSDRRAVLHVPFNSTPETVHNMLAQTAHDRPIAGGYLSTTPPEAERFIREEPALAQLEGLRPRLRRTIDVDRLAELGFGTIVLHKDPRGFAPPVSAIKGWRRRRGEMGRPGLDRMQMAAMRRALEAALGEAAFEDETIAAYALPP